MVVNTSSCHRAHGQNKKFIHNLSISNIRLKAIPYKKIWCKYSTSRKDRLRLKWSILSLVQCSVVI